LASHHNHMNLSTTCSALWLRVKLRAKSGNKMTTKTRTRCLVANVSSLGHVHRIPNCGITHLDFTQLWLQSQHSRKILNGGEISRFVISTFSTLIPKDRMIGQTTLLFLDLCIGKLSCWSNKMTIQFIYHKMKIALMEHSSAVLMILQMEMTPSKFLMTHSRSAQLIKRQVSHSSMQLWMESFSRQVGTPCSTWTWTLMRQWALISRAKPTCKLIGNSQQITIIASIRLS
jgi:hypothetical protein